MNRLNRSWLKCVTRWLAVGCGVVASVQAGAWSRTKGEMMAQAVGRYYQTDTAFDLSGEEQSISGVFRKREFNFYAEYGLGKGVTVLGNFFVDAVEYESAASGQIDRNAGLPNQELGVRWQFANGKRAQALQAVVSLDGAYDLTDTPWLGDGAHWLELWYYVGQGYRTEGQDWYWEFGVAPRLRSGAGDEQLHWLGTVGYKPGKWELALQLDGLHGRRLQATALVGSNVNVTPNFTLVKATASVLRRVYGRWCVYGAMSVHVAGRNAGAGGGAELGVRWD